MLDFHNVLWLKVLKGSDPGREGFWEQCPLKDIQRQVRCGVRRAVPLGGVLSLSAATVLPQSDAVPEVQHYGGVFWREAHEHGPWPGG